MCERVGTAGALNGAWQFRQKDLNDFNTLYKHQLRGWILVIYTTTGTWPEDHGDKVTNPSYFQSLLKSSLLLADSNRYFTKVMSIQTI